MISRYDVAVSVQESLDMQENPKIHATLQNMAVSTVCWVNLACAALHNMLEPGCPIHRWKAMMQAYMQVQHQISKWKLNIEMEELSEIRRLILYFSNMKPATVKNKKKEDG